MYSQSVLFCTPTCWEMPGWRRNYAAIPHGRASGCSHTLQGCLRGNDCPERCRERVSFLPWVRTGCFGIPETSPANPVALSSGCVLSTVRNGSDPALSDKDNHGAPSTPSSANNRDRASSAKGGSWPSDLLVLPRAWVFHVAIRAGGMPVGGRGVWDVRDASQGRKTPRQMGAGRKR